MPTHPDIPREALAAVANEVVRIKAQYYGRGPTEAKAYMNDEVLIQQHMLSPQGRDSNLRRVAPKIAAIRYILRMPIYDPRQVQVSVGALNRV